MSLPKTLVADDAIFFAALFILIGIGSFGLGRMSVAPGDTAPAQPAAAYLAAPEAQPVIARDQESGEAQRGDDGAAVVASKNGSKYHLPECPGAKQIHAENRIEFPSRMAATAAGYSPAANCPGLE